MSEPDAPAEIEIVNPHPVTAGYAFSFVVALTVLGAISVAWALLFVIAMVLLGLEGSGFPLLAVAATGYLLLRTWQAMAQTIRRRLHPTTVTDYDALPEAFGMLSRPLQRLVGTSRSTRATISDPDLPTAAVDRELFHWLTAVIELEGDDARYLEDRDWSVDGIRVELQAIGSSPRPHHRADQLLQRFEESLLNRGTHPFR